MFVLCLNVFVIRCYQPSEYDDRLLRVDPAKSRDDSAPPPLIGTIIPARYSASISSICWLNVSSRRYKKEMKKKMVGKRKNEKLNWNSWNFKNSLKLDLDIYIYRVYQTSWFISAIVRKIMTIFFYDTSKLKTKYLSNSKWVFLST